MRLLTAKPASLLPLLADDLGEVPRRSHGCNKERSGATSFGKDSSLRIPWATVNIWLKVGLRTATVYKM